MDVLSLDLGDMHVGVAVGERATRLAFARPSLTRTDDASLINAVAALADAEGVSEIVIGHPMTLAGGASQQTQRTVAFAKQLQAASKLPVVLVDERLSSAAARRTTPGEGEHSEAARLILESYLDRR